MVFKDNKFMKNTDLKVKIWGNSRLNEISIRKLV